MLRNLDPAASKFLSDLNRIIQRTDQASARISSGLRLSKPSDDPDQVSALLAARAELHRSETIRANLGRFQAEVDTAEQSLGTAVKIIERATVLGTQGVSAMQSAQTRATIAGEVEALLGQLVGLSQTAVEGRYIFSGDSDSTAPYALDTASPTGVTFYQGTGATRQAQHPFGGSFAVSKTAEEILDNPDPEKNVFQAVADLRSALLADDQAAIEAALTRLRTAGNHLNMEEAFYGAVQNQIADAIDAAHSTELRLKTKISSIEDADLTEAILELEQGRFHQEAALLAKSQNPPRSLFDFLK